MATDGLVWLLVVVAFCVGVACVLATQRLRDRQGQTAADVLPTRPRSADGPSQPGPVSEPSKPNLELAADVLVLPTDPADAASTIRALVLQSTAERMPAGWSALLVCPPDGRLPAIWHVHLAPKVVLAIPDGRTIPIPPPSPARAWTLPGGRVVTLAEGGTEPAITHETVTVQVAGPYLKVALTTGPGGQRRLAVSAFTDPRGPSEVRTDGAEARAIVGALRQAIELAVSGRMTASPPNVGYSRAAWDAHERLWIEVERT
jgi:hypothetical protein